MHLTAVAKFEQRTTADLLVLPYWKTTKGPHLASKQRLTPSAVNTPIALNDFKGNEGEILILYTKDYPEQRIALLGLGDESKLTTEALRRYYAGLAKVCHSKKIKNINLLVPDASHLKREFLIRGITEGLLLANYAFTKHKNEVLRANPVVLIHQINLINGSKEDLAKAKHCQIICEGVCMARDLTNTNADEISPQFLAAKAQEIAKKYKTIKTTVFDKKRIEKEKMGLLLAVSRGSAVDPAFIILEYKGSPKAKEHTVMIGKGITYDTGGLNIKTTGMETMKCDMAGAAAVLATLSVAAELKLPIHLTGVIPATENAVSGSSYKPGDCYTGYTGKTVEITNTDAEGRLVLADAIAYAEKNLKPTRIIDFATLTGGVDIALGNETTGMMSNNDALADQFTLAGSETFERVWRLPLFEEYKDLLKSDVADIKNAATRTASSICGAIFLQSFIEKTPWIHFDIASTAHLNEAKRYHPKAGTGIGVRLMIEFLKHL